MTVEEALKFNEIQFKFIEGIGSLLNRYSDPQIISKGISKLWYLKQWYENQLAECESVEEVVICFHCFDKPSGPCNDCD